ncbi:hypothetical protein, partial [Nonomuraea antimicrobica]|uniref:hypothetical protein n=1 Tax=Nonomuraea antimicrobica TaxID=561173 RepID=UPI0031EE3C90
MHQIIGSGVHPLPTFEIVPVENSTEPGKGCYVIVVAAGPRQPYAVAVNDGYRYPRRIGPSIGYLTEPEIETAYRRRDAARRDQAARAVEIEQVISNRLDHDNPWIMVSLVPDHPGQAPMEAATFKEVRDLYQGSKANPLVVGSMTGWRQVQPAQHRYLLDDRLSQDRNAKNMAAELYVDGAGVYAMTAPAFWKDGETNLVRFSDEKVVLILLS